MNYNNDIDTNYLNNTLTHSMARHEESERIMNNRYHHLTYRDGLKTFHHCIKNNEIIAEAFNNFLALREENFTQLALKNVVLINTALDKLEGILYFSVAQPNNLITHHAYNAQNGQWSTISDSIVFDLNVFRNNNNYIFHSKNTLDETNIQSVAISFQNINKVEDFWANSELIHQYINPNGRQQDINIDVENLVIQRNNNPNRMQQGIYDEENNIDVKYLGDSYYTSCVKTFCSILKRNEHIEQNLTFADGGINSAYNPCHTYLLPDDILSLNREPSKSARQ